MRNTLTLSRRIAIVTSLAAPIAACSVADSYRLDPAAIHASAYTDSVPTLCRSSLGSYALPKSFLKISVAQTDAGTAPPKMAKPVVVVRADKSMTFCLDHLSDPMADDAIRIIKSSGQDTELYASGTATQTGVGGKDYGTQLLQWVVSNTVNQSEYIARVLVRTAFIAMSGKPGFTPLTRSDVRLAAGAAANVVVLEYDPFDPEQSAQHNQRLRELGYCLVLENFTFDTHRMTVDQYCSAPRHVRFAYEEAYERYRSGPPPRVAGIAYRPRINYALSVYQSDDPKGRGRWRLAEQHRLAFENIAPVVSIGLTRSLFAARRVALQFDRGTLTAMCLVKTSELLSAVAVPYEIAKSIVALPTQVFEVKIGNYSDNIELLSAESDLIAAQKQYLDFLANPGQIAGAPSGAKAGEVSLDEAGIPKQANVVVTPSVVATMAALDTSNVLKKICSNAPSIVAGE